MMLRALCVHLAELFSGEGGWAGHEPKGAGAFRGELDDDGLVEVKHAVGGTQGRFGASR